MTAYYNEHDPYAAQWLRNLIAAGQIAPGIVDERDIRDIRPEELTQYVQCHFFAGLGVWPYALRRSGWPDDRPIWTGSCPCQPFSAAGRAGGFADERHLWPHWYHLISQCRPAVVAGEQVASKDGLGWLDLVSSDLEASGYAFGASDLCAAGITVEWESSQAGEWLRRAIHDCADPVIAAMLRDFADWAGEGNLGDGGDHIRQRLYFVGVADTDGEDGGTRLCDGEPTEHRITAASRSCGNGRLDHHHHQGPQRHAGDDGEALGQRQGSERPASATGVSDGLADDELQQRSFAPPDSDDARGRLEEPAAPAGLRSNRRTDAPLRGRGVTDWLFCRDGKWRPVESGTFPLAHGAPARVGRLRAYGNALDAETATEFVTTIREIIDGEPDAPVRCDGRMSFEDILG